MNEKSNTAKKGYLREFKNRKIGATLPANFVLIAALMVVIVAVSFSTFLRRKGDAEDTVKFDVPASVALQQRGADILEDTTSHLITSYFMKLERRKIFLKNLERWRSWKNAREAYRRRLQRRWLH